MSLRVGTIHAGEKLGTIHAGENLGTANAMGREKKIKKIKKKACMGCDVW